MLSAALRQWNSTIQSFTRDGFFVESLNLYHSLLKSGLLCDRSAFPSVVKACAQLGFIRDGRKVHSKVILLGLESDVFIQTSLLNLYSTCNFLSDARQLFDEMPSRTVVSWNSIISAYAKTSECYESFQLFNEMLSSGCRPTPSTFVGLVTSCSGSISSLQRGLSIHCHGIKLGFHSDLHLSNSILSLYVRFDLVDSGRLLFDAINNKSTITWTTIIGGYAKIGDCFEVFDLFNRMRIDQIELDAIAFVSLVSSCALLGRLSIASSVYSLSIRIGFDCQQSVAASVAHMFAKCCDVASARKVFDAVINKDIIMWTSMIDGYVQNGLPRTALDLFEKLLSTEVQPNKITINTILSACASIGSLSVAEQIEDCIRAYNLSSDLQIQTSLLHMYSKCGSLQRAQEIFSSISDKDLVAWSSMIKCYAYHGMGKEAVVLFEEMMKDRSIKPDSVVFTDILSACSHSGLVEEGLACFNRMQQDYGIEPREEHYLCMVDLLSRAGYFGSALELIHRVPIKSRSRLWTPFLSALRANDYLDILLKKRLEVDGGNSGNHVLLASLSASLGKWKEARGFRISMEKKGLMKEAGWSRIEI
ncbi:Pentatricopeptide repeat-containing protein [Apostasia shenzhenica]|uniref:Pentatricopeptide repeat-containing protein n=1 Tax=Apostasia shenzhenica TaxID=1088818 RepID=A0A2I0AY82_9ASPA|nr:Pentatricopeptide repeat-containing protein [Apostasia shenzhenica]